MADVAALEERLEAQQKQIDAILGRDAQAMSAAMGPGVIQNPMKGDGDERRPEEEEPDAAGTAAGSAATTRPPAQFTKFSAHCAAVRGEAPLNLHQATCYYCLVRPNTSLATKLPFFAASIFLVILQIVVSHSVFLGTFVQTCVKNSQCTFMEGSYCSLKDAKCKPCEQAFWLFGETVEEDANHNMVSAAAAAPFASSSEPQELLHSPAPRQACCT